MSTLTIQLPDEKYNRLLLAKKKHMSVDKLLEEVSTRALAEFDIESRFKARAAKESAQEGLTLLTKLDQLTKS